MGFSALSCLTCRGCSSDNRASRFFPTSPFTCILSIDWTGVRCCCILFFCFSDCPPLCHILPYDSVSTYDPTDEWFAVCPHDMMMYHLFFPPPFPPACPRYTLQHRRPPAVFPRLVVLVFLLSTYIAILPPPSRRRLFLLSSRVFYLCSCWATNCS